VENWAISMRTRCKPYSSNSVRRCKTASRVHQETWYDDGGWKKAGVYDRASCGYIKTSTSPAANAQVEFRIDCDNVTFSETDVAVIPNYKKVAAALLKKEFS